MAHVSTLRAPVGNWCALAEKNLWKQFFVPPAEFDEHNQSGMAREDLQGHRWCSAKLLFDYTPYATREDWLGELTYQRWM